MLHQACSLSPHHCRCSLRLTSPAAPRSGSRDRARNQRPLLLKSDVVRTTGAATEASGSDRTSFSPSAPRRPPSLSDQFFGKALFHVGEELPEFFLCDSASPTDLFPRQHPTVSTHFWYSALTNARHFPSLLAPPPFEKIRFSASSALTLSFLARASII
jgi:hypothetical protein